MDAALITGMFNVGFNNIAREPAKDVFIKKDSSFDEVLSKSMKKEQKDVKEKEVKKNGGTENTEVETKEDVQNKEVEGKDDRNKKVEDEKEDKKKVEDGEENKTDKINGLIENKLENVENIEMLENNDDTIKCVENINDEIKTGMMQNVYEVGPQNVETEKITLDKFEKLENKLDALAERLGLSSEDESASNLKDNTEFSSESEGDSDFEMLSSFNEEMLNAKDVKETVNKDDKFTIKDFRKTNTLENNLEQLEMDVQSIEKEIPEFDVSNVNNTMMNRAEKLQEQIDVLKQVTEKVTVNLLEDKSEMLIRLKPDNLGKVTMQVSIENGNITAKFLAESEKVKEILESNMQELKDHLAKQGMAVQDLSVSVGNDDNKQNMFEQRNYKTFRRNKSVDRIEGNSYFQGNGIYETNEVNVATYWPDSTVSFSA